MKSIIKIPCFVILFMMTIIIQAQETPKVIPPSPNAASLGVYGDIPVGYYTGVPNINIPLYEIVSGSMKVPISLSYHAAGIKVAQEASWVGLGWTLIAGGVITRSIRGWDDLSPGNSPDPKGYPIGFDLPTDFNYTMDKDGNETINSRYTLYAMNEEDSEPDIFYYNFGHYSGKIMLQKGNKPLIMNQDPLKIEQFSGGCIIRTPDGNAYYFGTAEETTVYNHFFASNSRIERGIQPNVVNSWYLDSIVSPKNDKVIFKYKRNSRCIRSQISATNSKFLDAPNGTPGVNWYVNTRTWPFNLYGYTSDSASDFNFSETTVDEVLLDEIIFDGGRVSFTTKGRTDLIANNPVSTIPQCLDKITIRNNLDVIIGSYQFNTNYFQSTNGITTDQNRLRLDKITDLACREYSFTYNVEDLPKKTSPSFDHWGLYNGANNEIFDEYAAIPTIEYKPGIIYAGADREASQEKAKAAILTRIDYPTGGYTLFDYELNDFYTENETMGFETISGLLYGGSSQIINLASETGIRFDFTFTKTEVGCPWEGGTCDSIHGFNNDYCYSGYLELQKKQTDGTWSTEVKYPYRNLGCIEGQSLKIGLSRTLSAGEYMIIVNSFETLNATCNYRYAYRTTAVENKGGGLRIKKIETSDGENITTTAYDYTMQINNEIRSTGVLMSKPQYHFTVSHQTINGAIGMIDGSSCYIDQFATVYRWEKDPVTGDMINFAIISPGYTKATSETIIPMGTSAQGSPVGYSQVTEIRQSAVSNGKTVYSFSNNPEYDLLRYGSSCMLTFPGIPNMLHNSNGNLLKKEYWNSQDQLLKQEMYEYKRADSVYHLMGVKLYSLGKIVIFGEDEYGDLYTPKDNYLIRFYDNNSERWNLIKDSTITYDYSVFPATEIKQVTQYYYDNDLHKKLTRKLTKNSNGKLITQTFKYPHDVTSLTGDAEAGRQKLLANWNIQAVMEEYQTIGEKTQIKQTEYESEFGLPKYINANTGPNQIMESRIKFQYDPKGNIRQYTLDGVTHMVYLWGYNGQYPIAEIKNATYEEVRDALGGETILNSIMNKIVPSDADWLLINNLRSNTTLKDKSYISIFMYKPLVGMTSQTDPNGVTTYFEYDSFGRLKNAKDKDQKILKHYQYHYYNEQ